MPATDQDRVGVHVSRWILVTEPKGRTVTTGDQSRVFTVVG